MELEIAMIYNLIESPLRESCCLSETSTVCSTLWPVFFSSFDAVTMIPFLALITQGKERDA
jgi:hypothetical protein